jgi:hypothetical protein
VFSIETEEYIHLIRENYVACIYMAANGELEELETSEKYGVLNYIHEFG